MNHSKKAGILLKKFRLESNLTQEALAIKSDITVANVRQIEKGVRSTGIELIGKYLQGVGKEFKQTIL